MRLIVPKGPSWTCELCHNRSNPARSISCTICRAERPQYRFALRVDGLYFICKIKVSISGPCISVCSVSTTSCRSFLVKVDENEDLSEDTLAVAVQRYLTDEAAATLGNEMIGFPEFDTEDEMTELKSNGGIVAELSNSPVKRAKGSRGAPPVMERSGSFMGMFDPGLSLFDTVMQNATAVAYNSKIGQFVSVKTMRPDPEAAGGAGTGTGEDECRTSTSLSYVESMRKERVVMTQVVKEVVRRRADDTYLYDAHADLDINRNEWDKEMECAMCERTYPKAQMPGQITFKAIADWKARHGAPFAPSDHRLDLVRLHDATRLCGFCTQFFDVHAVDRVDTQALKQEMGLAPLNLNGPLNCSNTVYKKMFRRATAKVADVEDRPLSRMRHRVALEQLRFKAASASNVESRYTFNPKFPNLVLDQEKVGKFLRTKYGGQTTTGALLLAEKKSVKLKLKPLTGTSGESGGVESAGHGSAFLTDPDAAVTNASNSGSTSHAGAANGSASRMARSLSAGRTSYDRSKPALGGKPTLLLAAGKDKHPHSSAVHRVKSDSMITHVGHGHNNESNDDSHRRAKKESALLARINQAYKEGLSSTAPAVGPGSLSPGKGALKTVSFGGSGEEASVEDMRKVRRRRRAKEGGHGGAKEMRKPLILKVSAATVVGTDEMGKVIEIELQSSVAASVRNSVDAPPSHDDREQAAGEEASTLIRRKLELNPLKGLLSHMQISKVEPLNQEQNYESPAKSRQKIVIVDKSPPAAADIDSFSPQSKGTKKSLRFQHSGESEDQEEHTNALKDYHHHVMGAKISATKALPPIKHAVQQKGRSSKQQHQQQHLKSSNKKDNSPTWKRNIHKPVLVDVLNPAARRRQDRDHSYITQVLAHDDFMIDASFCEGPDADLDSVAASDHDYIGVASLPLGRSVRSDSFEQQQEAEADYADDDFEVEEGMSPGGQLHDTLLEGDSMDKYNWVSEGPYEPPEGGGGGFSPLMMLEPSLFGPASASASERMKMLSRGSAGGLLTPSSRGVLPTGSRRYSGRHTPKLLSSAGSGIAPVTPTSAAGRAKDGNSSSSSRNAHHRKIASKLVGTTGGTTSPGGVSSGRFHSQVRKMEPAPATKEGVLEDDVSGSAGLTEQKAAVRRRSRF